MKNLTLRVDENTLAKARLIAAEQSTSVSELIRDFLNDLISQETRRDEARRELVALCEGSEARVGSKDWTRNSLHER
ncbi:MAG: DUF6364 family protein [Opitutales bacterium]|nr:DUF6364 family protein [Opitutales bacterium]NRA27637.1 hypothetical protein [Opitutales bacterium]